MTIPVVLTFGGRVTVEATRVFIALDQFHLKTMGGAVFAIMHGGAKGADSISGAWAKKLGFPEIIVPANWDYFGNRAGPTRNRWMVDVLTPVFAIGFPGGYGTANMARLCVEREIPLWRPFGEGI